LSTLDQTSLYGSRDSKSRRKEAFRAGQVPVAVYGLGKMGLPLAGVFAEVSGNVVGADIDPDVVNTINNGDCHVKREPGLPSLVADLHDDDSLRAVSEPSVAAEDASVHVIIVPTPITDESEPDLSILRAVTEEIATGISSGDLVIVECTVPPGTTAGRVHETLLAESDLEAGEFGVAFCPERTSSGRALKDIRGAYPKVVGGVDDESTQAAKLIYEEINSKGVLTVSDATTAEAVKVFEGLYRDVNIALANELAQFTDELGIDINEAIETANTQPFCDIHDPGPGVGGHCIPFYPYFMIKPFETDSPLLQTARHVNDSMPEFTVQKLREEFAAEGGDIEDKSVLVLGLTYRPGVEEIRASPSLGIAESLSSAGADVYGVDPILDEFDAFELCPLDIESIYERDFDAVVVVTPHEEFEKIRWQRLRREGEQLIVVDGRDTLDLSDTDHRVYTIGSGYDV